MTRDMRHTGRVDVAGANAVELVAGGIMAMPWTSMPWTSAVTAREAEEGHRGHASGAKNDAENVEVHLSTHGSQRVFTSAKC